MKRKILWLIPVAVLLAFAAAFLLYTSVYYHASDDALPALGSDTVIVTETDYGWFFDGPDAGRALIFYPGAKVEETAYAPLLHALADAGIDVCLVRMPFHMAVFGMDRATGIMEQVEYDDWYIGGHSLGGAVAANYAADHDLNGVILLASYPTKDVDEPMLIIYGSEDGELNLARIAEAERYGKVDKIVIEGGNHAGFGSYGAQRGDNAAAVTEDEQQRLTAESILSWLS